MVAEATLGARLTRRQAPPEAPPPSAMWKLPRGLVTSSILVYLQDFSCLYLPGFCHCRMSPNRERHRTVVIFPVLRSNIHRKKKRKKDVTLRGNNFDTLFVSNQRVCVCVIPDTFASKGAIKVHLGKCTYDATLEKRTTTRSKRS